jgi:hypothetical protein
MLAVSDRFVLAFFAFRHLLARLPGLSAGLHCTTIFGGP